MYILDLKDIMMKRMLSKRYKNKLGARINPSTWLSYKSLIIIILLGLFMAMNVQIKVLEASHFKTGEYFKSWKIKATDIFEIDYTHSVQLTAVSEIYFIDDNYNIVLEESYFHSYGAGLPSTTPYEFEITKDGFRIYNIGEVMENLIYRTGAVRANHHIKIKDKIYPFLSFSEPEDGVKFSVGKILLYKYLVKEVL